ncbi:stage II sporulation protein M [Maribellus sp. CM-23]|uniref:stage II sporulation protein M n=1 Tax=Maribellus sp. CM-23 TaxID=2781026 RepID=UPI001F1DBA5C|nr:stage II sporulation protein M [Maribellus sp. CM-23]MCE4563008.1 stage II sporulation protein M [Maribellus sp. CM-23]
MKEIVFVKRNSEKWEQIEKLLHENHPIKPDDLYNMYIGLNDDLSYAATFFSQSETHVYLNNLTVQLHQKIYLNRKIKRNRFVEFWKTEYPLLFWQNRRYFWYASAIFIISIIIGAFSTSVDNNFPRIILGDHYVNMTLQNISHGDPMAVYKKANEMDMFLGITINNIRVAFLAFVAGVFFSVGTGFILLKNGIMLGCFQYFFYQYGLMRESVLTIYIHGTLELFSIVVAGAAGMVIGNSILFPDTLPRVLSFRKGAVTGLKIVSGVVPVFMVAGFLEGYVTRHTELPDMLRGGIILLSLVFIVWYFFLYPGYLLQKSTN